MICPCRTSASLAMTASAIPEGLLQASSLRFGALQLQDPFPEDHHLAEKFPGVHLLIFLLSHGPSFRRSDLSDRTSGAISEADCHGIACKSKAKSSNGSMNVGPPRDISK